MPKQPFIPLLNQLPAFDATMAGSQFQMWFMRNVVPNYNAMAAFCNAQINAYNVENGHSGPPEAAGPAAPGGHDVLENDFAGDAGEAEVEEVAAIEPIASTVSGDATQEEGVPAELDNSLSPPVSTLGLTGGAEKALVEAGFESVASAQAATDETLLALKGFGPGALKKVRG